MAETASTRVGRLFGAAALWLVVQFLTALVTQYKNAALSPNPTTITNS